MTNFELLQRLCETPGVPGREEQIRALIVREMTPLVDEIRVDKMGSVIGTKKGMDGPTVMIAAHMDEIGFIVKHVDDKGFLRVQPLGGFDPRNLVAQRVHVHCHTGEILLGVFQPSAEGPDADRAKSRKLHELYIDLGLSADDVKAKIELGDPITLARTCERVGGTVVSKSLDNRLSVFVMLEALRTMSASRCTIHAVATVQEEVGLRGARTAADLIKPDIGIAIEGGIAGDSPGRSPEETQAVLGGGPGLFLYDSSTLPNRRFVALVGEVATSNGIPLQKDLVQGYGDDSAAIQATAGGVPTLNLVVPARYTHAHNGIIDRMDFDRTVNLVVALIQRLDAPTVARLRSFAPDR